MVKKDPGARMRLCASCLFGLEGPLGNELRHMGMESVAPENGRVLFRTGRPGSPGQISARALPSVFYC